VTASEFTLDLFMALGSLWGFYLFVSGLAELSRRHRRRAWWREPERGDYVRLRGKL
jgi:hypothetical protein